MTGPAIIEVPPSQPDPLRKPDGDVAGADELATTLYRAASRFGDVSDEATSLGDMHESWWGDAYEAYQGAAGRAAGEHEQLADTARRVARAVTAYADNLREHLRTYDDQVDTKGSIDRDRDQLMDDIAAATDVTDAEIAQLRSRAGGLRTRYDALVTAHDELNRSVRDNEDTLRQVFTSATRLDQALSDDSAVPPAAVEAMGRPGAPGSGATPQQVADWWAGLTEAQQEAVTTAYPGTIGSADGLPASARDQANRILLEDDLARLGAAEDDGTLTADEHQVLENARAAETALQDADAYTDPLSPDVHPGGQLWLYDPGAFDGDGRVAVGVGDLDTADDVAVFTPGISTRMTDVPGYTGQMMNLYESARYNGDGSSVATMFWLGYDSPSGPVDGATYTHDRAADGGERLADAVAGMRASRSDDPATNFTAIGHSYGSTTTSYAATEHGLDVDQIALIGSPGAGQAEDAGDLGVGADNVYVGRDSRDFVATLGDEGWATKGSVGIGLGRDPSEDEFGATRFEAERTDRGAWGYGTGDAHSSYLANDSESLYNLGLIVDGHGDQVNTAEHTYDPWYSEAEDPEYTRDPTADVEGRSDTTERR